MRSTSAAIRSTIGAGVPLGATSTNHDSALYPGRVREIGGTSGNAGLDSLEVTPSAIRRPDLMNPIADGRLSMARSRLPAARSCSIGPLPR